MCYKDIQAPVCATMSMTLPNAIGSDRSAAWLWNYRRLLHRRRIVEVPDGGRVSGCLSETLSHDTSVGAFYGVNGSCAMEMHDMKDPYSEDMR